MHFFAPETFEILKLQLATLAVRINQETTPQNLLKIKVYTTIKHST
jgi:hypothetical protein